MSALTLAEARRLLVALNENWDVAGYCGHVGITNDYGDSDWQLVTSVSRADVYGSVFVPGDDSFDADAAAAVLVAAVPEVSRTTLEGRTLSALGSELELASADECAAFEAKHRHARGPAGTLALWAYHSSIAKRARLRGDIDQAQRSEASAERVYHRLPEGDRW